MAPPDSAISDEFLRERMRVMRPIILATVLRVGRRIEEGFEGEITIQVKQGGVHFIRWTQTETGNIIKEELGI